MTSSSTVISRPIGYAVSANPILAINEKVRGQLFKMMRENFKPSDEPGYYVLDFHVGGTVERASGTCLPGWIGAFGHWHRDRRQPR